MQIALASAAEAREVAHVKVAGWRDTYAPWVSEPVLAPFLDVEAVAGRIAADLGSEENFALVARDDDRVLAGIATFRVTGRSEPLLDSLHVVSAARGSGIGGALLRAGAQELARRGWATFMVEVVEPNVRAMRFYERHGAVEIGSQDTEWAPGELTERLYRISAEADRA